MESQSPQHVALGFAGTNMLIVSQVLTRDCVPIMLWSAVAIFAFTLPLNIMFYVIDDDFVAAQREQRHTARLNILFARFVGLLILNIIGLALVFLHLGLLPGALFVFTSACLIVRVLSGGHRGATFLLLRRVFVSLFRRVPPSDNAS